MFFKNIRPYKITESIELLPQALAAFGFNPCTSQQAESTGFFGPWHPHAEGYAVDTGRFQLLAVKTQRKLLPAAVITEELAPKIRDMEQEKGRPLSRKEKQVLKEELVQTLLPRAMVKSEITRAFYDNETSLLLVDTSSASRAETVLALLRKSLGSLPVLPAFDNHQLNQQLHFWLQSKALPDDYVLGDSAELKAPDEEGANVRFANHLLTSDEVQSHLQDKLVTKLNLQKRDAYSFTVCEDGSIKQVKFSDQLIFQNDDQGWDNVLARLDSDAILGCTQMVNLVLDINKNLGAE